MTLTNLHFFLYGNFISKYFSYALPTVQGYLCHKYKNILLLAHVLVMEKPVISMIILRIFFPSLFRCLRFVGGGGSSGGYTNCVWNYLAAAEASLPYFIFEETENYNIAQPFIYQSVASNQVV